MDHTADPGRHRARLSRRARLLLAGGGGLGAGLAAVVAVAVVGTAGAACAAPPVAGTTHSGQATHYQLEGGGGNCSYPGPPGDELYVALGPGEYADAAGCGGYLDVTGPRGSVRVKVVDQCPECAPGHIDLSRTAFARIADLSQGIVPVTYESVRSPAVAGGLSFRLKDGVSAFWFALLVDDHGTPLATVAARGPDTGFQTLVRHDFNYWVHESGLGSGPFTVRVTDVYGATAEVSGITLAPERVQRTDARLGEGAAAGRQPEPSERAEQTPDAEPSARPSPRPEPSPSESSSPAPLTVRVFDPPSTPDC